MKSIKKVLALALALAMVVTAVPVTSAEAATTGVAKTKTYYVGKSYTLTLTTPSTWKSVKTTWTTSKKSVASLSSKKAKSVKVTAVKAGSATVKAKVSYKKNGKTQTAKTYSCKVTVKDPTLTVGNTPSEVVVGSETDLAVTVKPASSKITYESTNEDVATVEDGKLVAKAAGTTAITVKVGSQSKTFVVKVVGTNTVKSVEAISASEIKITFNERVVSPYPPVLGTDIVIVAGTGANSAANVTGALAEDGLSYTITSASALKGEYTVSTGATLKNETGASFEAFSTKVTVNDTTAPTVTGTSYSKNGKVFYVEYSEAVSAGSAVVTRADGTALKSTITVSKKDAKTLQIAISGLTDDENKDLNAVVTGVTDLAGNPAAAQTFTVKFDTTPVAQATITSITRTSLSSLTVKFSASLESAPTVAMIGTTAASGIVLDADDDTVVYITLPNSSLTGAQLVTIGGWKAYKTSAAAANEIKTVDFTYNAIAAPVITGVTYVAATDTTAAYYLVSYDKNICFTNGVGALSTASGYVPGETAFTVKKNLTNGTITTVSAKAVSHVGNTSNITATTATSSKLVLDSMPTTSEDNGTYTITIPAGVAVNEDGIGNAATTVNVTVTIAAASAGKLDAPVVAQKANDTSVITVKFGSQVDVESAQTVSNYNLIGGTVSSATVVENSTAGATVELQVVVPNTANYSLVVSNVKGYNSSKAAMDSATYTLSLKDSTKPTIVKASVAAIGTTTTPGQITVTFSENVTCSKADSSDALKLKAGDKVYTLQAAADINGTTATFEVYADANCTTGAVFDSSMLTGTIVAGGSIISLVDSTGVNYVAIPDAGISLN
jgi:hypothetical protein